MQSSICSFFMTPNGPFALKVILFISRLKFKLVEISTPGYLALSGGRGKNLIMQDVCGVSGIASPSNVLPKLKCLAWRFQGRVIYYQQSI